MSSEDVELWVVGGDTVMMSFEDLWWRDVTCHPFHSTFQNTSVQAENNLV